MTTNYLKSALKAKAPIVAIPVEGRAPVCVDSKLLRSWSKGVEIDSVTVEVTGGQWYPDLEDVSWYSGAEGPKNMVAKQAPEYRRLVIVGHVGRIKTRCSIIPIDRRVAVRTLGEWSIKEREKMHKKILRGALDTTFRKNLKRAQFEEMNTEETVLTYYSNTSSGKEVMETRRGIPVSIPEAQGIELALVRAMNSNGEVELWSVTARRTGKQSGTGKNAEDALIDARTNFQKAGEARVAELAAICLKSELPKEQAIAA